MPVTHQGSDGSEVNSSDIAGPIVTVSNSYRGAVVAAVGWDIQSIGCVVSCMLSALLLFVVQILMATICKAIGRVNVARKSLVDKRFLI